MIQIIKIEKICKFLIKFNILNGGSMVLLAVESLGDMQISDILSLGRSLESLSKAQTSLPPSRNNDLLSRTVGRRPLQSLINLST